MKKFIMLLITIFIMFTWINVHAKFIPNLIPQCEYDFNCDLDEICKNSKCEKLLCNKGKPTNHQCKILKNGETCSADKECGSNRCIEYRCVECVYDSDCSNGRSCNKRTNTCYNNPCYGTYEIPNGSGGCKSCGANEVANTYNNACVCDAGFERDNNKCIASCTGTDEIKDRKGGCVQCPQGEVSNGTNDTCICDKGYYRDGKECVPCKKGTYKAEVGDGTGDERSCTTCTGNTVALSTGSEKCDICKTGYACNSHDKCGNVTGIATTIGKQLLSVNREANFNVSYTGDCGENQYGTNAGFAYGVKIPISGSSTNGRLVLTGNNPLFIKGKVIPTEKCQNAIIKITIGNYTLTQTINVVSNWESVNVYMAEKPCRFCTNPADYPISGDEADIDGKFFYVGNDCDPLPTGGYSCKYNYRGCPAPGPTYYCYCKETKDGLYENCKSATKAPSSDYKKVDSSNCNPTPCTNVKGCYADPDLGRVRWFDEPCKGGTGKYTVYLNNVSESKCVNKCDSKVGNNRADVTHPDQNTCSADVKFGTADFSTTCVNDNSLVLQKEGHENLYSINCKEDLNYKINYKNVNGEVFDGSNNSIKIESGVKVNVDVNSTIHCTGTFDKELYVKGWQVLTNAPDTLSMDNEYFWKAALSKYQTDALEYTRWIKDKDYVLKATATDGVKSSFSGIDGSGKGTGTTSLVNTLSNSDGEGLNVKCISSKCMSTFTPSGNINDGYNGFDVTFKYNYQMKLPVAKDKTSNVKYGNQFIIEKKMLNGNNTYKLKVSTNNMGYYKNWNYTTICSFNTYDEMKYRIIDVDNPFLSYVKDRGVGDNWQNLTFDFTEVIK